MLVNEYSCISKLGKRNYTEMQVENSQNLAYYVNHIGHCFQLHKKIYGEVNCLITVNYESIPLGSLGYPWDKM